MIKDAQGQSVSGATTASIVTYDLAVRAYKSVDCRDFGRVDFRVDEKGNPYVLEINPLPNLSPDDVFVLFGKVKGMSYNQIINKIMDEALIRLGLMEGSLQK